MNATLPVRASGSLPGHEFRGNQWTKEKGLGNKIEFFHTDVLETNPNEVWSERYAKEDGRRHVDNLKSAISKSKRIQALTGQKIGDKVRIIDGQHRLKALKELGHTHIGVQVVNSSEILRAVREEQLARRIEAVITAASPKYGCLMAQLPGLEPDLPLWALDNIPGECLHSEGIEQEVHCTVLYGFHLNFDARKIQDVGDIVLKLGKVSRFECPDYDVLKLAVDSPDLVALNKRLAEEFKDEITPSKWDYNPHVTIAYVKKGMCKHLDGDDRFAGRVITVRQLLYSLPERQGRVVIEAGEKVTPVQARYLTEDELLSPEQRRMRAHTQAQDAAREELRKAVRKALQSAELAVLEGKPREEAKGSFLLLLWLGAAAAYAAVHARLAASAGVDPALPEPELEDAANGRLDHIDEAVDDTFDALEAEAQAVEDEKEPEKAPEPAPEPRPEPKVTIEKPKPRARRKTKNQKLADRLAKKAQELEGTRWERPVEVMGQQSYGQAALRVLHLGGFKTKIWSQLDRPTKRHSHEKNVAFGEVPLSFVYPNGQTHPGDENGGVGEIVNCLCQLVGGSRVEPDVKASEQGHEFRGNQYTKVFRAMPEHEFKRLEAGGEIEETRHPGNQFTTDIETAKYYHSQIDGPAHIAEIEAPSHALLEDSVFKGDFRAKLKFKPKSIRKWKS